MKKEKETTDGYKERMCTLPWCIILAYMKCHCRGLQLKGLRETHPNTAPVKPGPAASGTRRKATETPHILHGLRFTKSLCWTGQDERIGAEVYW